MKPSLRLLALALAALVTSAHVGDTNTHFRGLAGAYPVRVVVRHPGVVPGLADITIRVEGEGVRGVTVQPVPPMLGLEGAPPPDAARAVPGESGLYTAELWFMTSGTYSVHVAVDGIAGGGTALVPVISIATRRLSLGPDLALLLIALGVLLAAGLVTIVRAAVRDSVMEAGELPDPSHVRRGRIASVVTVALIVVLLTGGRAWWGAEDAAYQSTMFEPIDVQVTADDAAGMLHLALVDPDWLARSWTPIVPDHGKMMHAFLVRLPDQDAFAHVHPQPLGRDSFRLALPPLPPGDYAFYADVVHESGFAQTLRDTVRIGLRPPAGGADPDDAWWTGRPGIVQATATPAVARFDDGSTLTLERAGEATVTLDRELTMRFIAREPDGSATPLDPYMGMAAHVAVRRADGGVFVHLHPSGSIAMASQRQIILAETAHLPQPAGSQAAPFDSLADTLADTVAAVPDSVSTVPADSIVPPATPTAGRDSIQLADSASAAITGAAGAMDPLPMPVLDPAGVVTIPYAFPMEGDYRVFVQTKRNGVVRTAVFAVRVVSEP